MRKGSRLSRPPEVDHGRHYASAEGKRRENGSGIQAACAQFVVLCRQLGLFGAALVAIDGSKFKAVNTRDKNFTATKLKKLRMAASRQFRVPIVVLRPCSV